MRAALVIGNAPRSRRPARGRDRISGCYPTRPSARRHSESRATSRSRRRIQHSPIASHHLPVTLRHARNASRWSGVDYLDGGALPPVEVLRR